MARIIDGVILGIVFSVLNLVLTGILVTQAPYDLRTGAPAVESGLFLATLLVYVLATAIYIAYEFFMLRMNGQTVGKMVMGIKVVRVNGTMAPGGLDTDVALKRAGVLWGPYAANFIPFVGWLLAYGFYIVNVLWQFWDKPLQQCLHDKVAATVVVKAK
ncbi:RDD family protein [Thermocatellispora tengchongensis]|uniref:RDD family protein n=1 Tax=Thermocatellispora tengchongensis TaxID=1073253 RepID=UPI003625A7DE